VSVVLPASGGGGATITLRHTVIDPQGAGDLAEDQIFALSNELGLAYVLRNAGGDHYSLQVSLPSLGVGLSIRGTSSRWTTSATRATS
jgi:hypothetical protein